MMWYCGLKMFRKHCLSHTCMPIKLLYILYILNKYSCNDLAHMMLTIESKYLNLILVSTQKHADNRYD